MLLRKDTVLAGLLLALLAGIPAAVPQQPSIDEKQSLAGVSGLYVTVEDINDTAKADGLSAEQLKTDVERRLRLAGIKVGYGFSPFLYVQIAYIKNARNYAFNINVEFQQLTVTKVSHWFDQ